MTPVQLVKISITTTNSPIHEKTTLTQMMALNIQPSKTQTLPKCGTSMWCEGLHAFVILEATCIMCWEGFG